MQNHRLHTKISDSNLIRREIYNPHDFIIEFRLAKEKLQYINAVGITPGAEIIRVMPNSFAILNHCYHRIYALDVRTKKEINDILISPIINFGDQIGIGNTKPSRPDFKLR